jgi:hypothetical protein
MALQIGDNHVANRDDRWIAAGKSLDRHLSAAQKNQLHIQPIFTKNSFIFDDPELRLPRADGWIADADFVKRLTLGVRSQRKDRETNRQLEILHGVNFLMLTTSFRQATTSFLD